MSVSHTLSLFKTWKTCKSRLKSIYESVSTATLSWNYKCWEIKAHNIGYEINKTFWHQTWKEVVTNKCIY